MKTIETDRLVLRQFRYTDYEDLYEYAKNPHVGPNAGWKPHEDMDETKSILKNFVEEDEVLAIVWKANNKVIGSLGLHKDPLRSADDVKMLGYVLSEDYWGKGIITEASRAVLAYAFTDLNLKLVSVQHYVHNQKSRRVIEKCGFKYEGTLRYCTKIFNGNTYDLMCYSMTKDEWEKLYG
jgi:putative acetyltransferase